MHLNEIKGQPTSELVCKKKDHAWGVPIRGTIISGRTVIPWFFTETAAWKIARACISVSSGYDIPSLFTEFQLSNTGNCKSTMNSLISHNTRVVRLGGQTCSHENRAWGSLLITFLSWRIFPLPSFLSQKLVRWQCVPGHPLEGIHEVEDLTIGLLLADHPLHEISPQNLIFDKAATGPVQLSAALV